jgi:hypothetical protein
MTSSASKWFQDRIKGLPAGCLVRTSVKVRPDTVPGDHVSAALARGVRTWGFPTEAEADAFRAKYAEQLRKR